MAFSAITSAQILPGKPVKNELWTKVKDNFDDHETRIVTLESSSNTIDPIRFELAGDIYRRAIPITDVWTERVTYNRTISQVRLIALTSGGAGTFEIDIQKKTGAGPFASIFTVKPLLTGPITIYASNSGTLATTALLSGDLLRLDITANGSNITRAVIEIEVFS